MKIVTDQELISLLTIPPSQHPYLTKAERQSIADHLKSLGRLHEMYTSPAVEDLFSNLQLTDDDEDDDLDDIIREPCCHSSLVTHALSITTDLENYASVGLFVCVVKGRHRGIHCATARHAFEDATGTPRKKPELRPPFLSVIHSENYDLTFVKIDDKAILYPTIPITETTFDKIQQVVNLEGSPPSSSSSSPSSLPSSSSSLLPPRPKNYQYKVVKHGARTQFTQGIFEKGSCKGNEEFLVRGEDFILSGDSGSLVFFVDPDHTHEKYVPLGMALWKGGAKVKNKNRNGVLPFDTLLQEAVTLLGGGIYPIFQQEFSLTKQEISSIEKERQDRQKKKKKNRKPLRFPHPLLCSTFHLRLLVNKYMVQKQKLFP